MTEEQYNQLAEEIATESDNENWDSRDVLRGIGNELNALTVLFSLNADSTLRAING